MRVRFTVRRMMAAIALVALAVVGVRWVVEMRRRSADYRADAYMHALSRHVHLLIAEAESPHRLMGGDAVARRRALESAEYHERMERLYKKAASRPWLRVEDHGFVPTVSAPIPPVKEDRPKKPGPPDEPGYHLEWPTLRREQSPASHPKRVFAPT